LTWETEGPDIVIRDRRRGLAPCDYRLQDYAVVAFHALDQPRAAPALMRANVEPLLGPKGTLRMLSNVEELHDENGERHDSYPSGGRASRSPWRMAGWAVPHVPERTIAFGEEEFSIKPHECLKPLLDAGLVFEEEGWYLALPVCQSWSRMSALPEVLQSALAPSTEANAP
jgi:hypothetical protein